MTEAKNRNPMFVPTDSDVFLSEEDLDLGNLEWPERISTWNWWLSMMQATNEEDKDDYSHGVFLSDKQKRDLWGENWEEEIDRIHAESKRQSEGA